MVHKNHIISSTLSLIKSDLINADMKPAYINFLRRLLSSSRAIDDDEIQYINQELIKHAVKVKNFTEGDALSYLARHAKENRRNPDESKPKKEKSSSPKNKDNISIDYRKEMLLLKESVAELRTELRQAIDSREKWRKRAELAESKMKDNEGANDLKFRKVKAKFSRMYHPDRVAGSSFEKIMKQEVFKEFWPIIEDVEKEG
ncbi:hypothetical protein SAMN05216203_3007 [Marinobacter daqiaonensis]|uniref:Uncharacterized protein n=1 Tax=Marinobacter daqiaonensis TaxID=650891 RepID=A0A1I6JH33_9GAMM|nr:hypothetical protein [Marinobacter daqiaonensis]SFR78169.1 hypothetical protein SAMN05216203_3007 [Marinobacter daqiaonensis]